MNEIPERLQQLWSLDEPQAPDIWFRIGVIDRLERRRFWIELLRLVPPVFVIGLVTWASAPLLPGVMPRSDLVVLLAGVLGLVGILTTEGSPFPN